MTFTGQIAMIWEEITWFCGYHRHTLFWKKHGTLIWATRTIARCATGCFVCSLKGSGKSVRVTTLGIGELQWTSTTFSTPTAHVVSMRQAIVPRSLSSAGGTIRRSYSLFSIRGENPRWSVPKSMSDEMHSSDSTTPAMKRCSWGTDMLLPHGIFHGLEPLKNEWFVALRFWMYGWMRHACLKWMVEPGA